MYKPKEIIDAYVSCTQRNLLIKIFSHEFSRENLFLTGGTALSVFYFGHRKSRDLDLFVMKETDLLDYVNFFRNVSSVKRVISEGKFFCSYIYEGDIKVDFVFDKFSTEINKEKAIVEEIEINIDSLKNICINKISAVVSRAEPKDIVDLTWLFIDVFNIDKDFLILYDNAQKREAILEDYLYVAGLFNYIATHTEEVVALVKDTLIKNLKHSDIEKIFSKFESLIKKRVF